MNIFKRLWGKDDSSSGKEAFWTWFLNNEQTFYPILQGRDHQRVNDRFIEKVMPRLQALNKEFYCEAGMFNETIAELVISAEGDIKSFVWAEELVSAAPQLDNWRFTALKPATGAAMSLSMDGYEFNSGNISFYYEEDPQYPDEIDLILVHKDYTEANKTTITHGTLLFLDSLLGELDAATLIDSVAVKSAGPAGKAPHPMEKLNDFLIWKEKEFIEKYHATRHDTERDQYSILEATDEDGLVSVAAVDTDLLGWDAKASHPWMMLIEIDYQKTNGLGNNGMPNDKHIRLMSAMEQELTEELTDSAGYLNLGRQTYKGKRTIYLACKEFRTASKKASELILAHKKDLSCTYDIYKDKYWRTMNAFRAQP
jgi:hypothetical protein